LILKALRHANGNKSQAARALSIHDSTLRAKMKRYNIN
jgi:DNA-binding NtrC family response regulator